MDDGWMLAEIKFLLSFYNMVQVDTGWSHFY